MITVKDCPKPEIPEKFARLLRHAAKLQIGLYSASAGFFIVLAVFPALLVLAALLRRASLNIGDLDGMLRLFLPEALLGGAEELLLSAYESASGGHIGLWALAALWSAGRGVYGLTAGLNAVYAAEETRGYFRRRMTAVTFTLAAMLVLVLTLVLDVFWERLAAVSDALELPLLSTLTGAVNARLILLPGIQIGFFCGVFRMLPNRKSSVSAALPGALLAAGGWRLLTALYSLYAEHFGGLRRVYGSVYAISLSMLWVYSCVALILSGGALNRYLEEKRGKT